jgi:OOP family OmpA-OmpF porin
MPGTRPESRYRRRVLGVGGLAAFMVYVIGAPIFNNRIENDLERRVPAALEAAGHGTIAAKFSGQEGTLTCATVLADPEGALAVAHAVHGVDSVQLDRACRVNTMTGSSIDTATPAPTEPGGTAPSGSAASVSAPSATGTGDTPGTSVPDFATVGALIGDDGEFATLALLTERSALAAELADAAAGPFTVFAPTDGAFDALPSETAALLDSDAELSDRVVSGHVIDGALTSDALAALNGTTLATLAGTNVAVAVDGDVVTLNGARVAGGPIETANGVVFSLDQVLLPEEIAAAPTGAEVAATLSGGRLVLTGTVADQPAHDALVGAATAAVGAERVDNALAVDADSGVDGDTAAQVAALIGTLDAELVSGVAGYDGAALYLTGAYANDAAAVRATDAAAALGATTDIAPRAAASADQAAALETELNDYVRANPILFQPNSAVLEQSALAIIDRVAAGLLEFGGLSVVVAGHTDSDGLPATNQTLSEQRAAAVRQVLIELGVEEGAITSVGFGSQQPVLEGGLENKSASRRVEFQISAG